MAHFLASSSQYIDHIQSLHRALVDHPRLVLPSGRLYVALILPLPMTAAFANFHVRSQQFSYWFAENDRPQALLTTGNKITPVTAALTVIVIILYLGAAGYWLEASVAAVGGGLCMAYLERSPISRIYTDQFNLGFFYLLFRRAIWAGWHAILGCSSSGLCHCP